MKGSGSPRHDSKDDLKVDLDSNFSHSHGKSFYLYVLIKKVMLNLSCSKLRVSEKKMQKYKYFKW